MTTNITRQPGYYRDILESLNQRHRTGISKHVATNEEDEDEYPNEDDYSEVSDIANDAAYAYIVQSVNTCLAEYKKANKRMTTQVRNDIAYVNNALAQFATTRNVDDLIQALIEQDTYAREFYAYVIDDLRDDYYNGAWA